MSDNLNEDDIFGDVFSADDFSSGLFEESSGGQNFGTDESESSQFAVGEGSGKGKESVTDSEKTRGKKAAVLLLGISFMALLVLGIGIRLANREPKQDTKKQQAAQKEENVSSGKINTSGELDVVVVQTPSNGTTSSGSSSKSPLSEWIRVGGGDIALSKRIQGVLVVTDIQYLAKKTSAEDIKLEMDVRLVGYVPGIDGSYALHIPWRVADRISVGDKVNIYYYIGEIDGSRVVVDISYSE